MGYLIEPGFIEKTVRISEADFQNCGITPALLLTGKPNMVFQFFSIMAYAEDTYQSATSYTIISSVTNHQIAGTHFDNFNSGFFPCIYNIGSNLATDNTQRAANNLLVSTKGAADPVGFGDVVFKLIYKELFI
jgi:hypothetical protein